MPAPRNAPTQTRRTVLRTAAWTAPVVAAAAAAPARAAASPCADGYLEYVLDWSSYTRASTTSATGTALPVEGVGDPITVSISAAITLVSGITLPNSGAAPNLSVVNSVVNIVDGSPARPLLRGLALSMICRWQYEGQNVSFSFSRPVENVRFAIGDIDNYGTTNTAFPFYRDGVALSPVGFTWSNGYGGAPTSSTGDGTSGDPWRVQNNFNESWESTGRREVRATYAGPLNTFTVQLRNWVARNSPSPGAEETVIVSPLYFRVPC